MKQLILTIITALACLSAGAQTSEQLYQEGKALYNAKKYAEAVPKLEAAAKAGHKIAQYRLARCYDKGRGVTESDSKAFQWYLKSAEQGYAKAQYELGDCYKDGDGTMRDRQKAVKYFTLAAKQGHAEAQFALGKCYMRGQGVTADQQKAKTWLTKAYNNPKGGQLIRAELQEEVAEGDGDAKAIMKLIGK